MKIFKFIPTLPFALSNVILILSAIVLFFGRNKSFLKIDFLSAFFPDFYQHISNFSISYLMLSGIGFMWSLLGIQFKFITFVFILLVAINFIYEMRIPVLNTPDIIDAYYGLWGAMLAFIFLLLIKKYGLRPNPQYIPKP